MIIFLSKNTKNDKVFVGYSLNDEAKTVGTGKYISKAIKTYGMSSFEKIVLEKFDNEISLEHLFERVDYWIEKYKADDPKYGYNEAISEISHTNRKLTKNIQVLLSHSDAERLNDVVIETSMKRGTSLTVSGFIRELILKEINKNNKIL